MTNTVKIQKANIFDTYTKRYYKRTDKYTRYPELNYEDRRYNYTPDITPLKNKIEEDKQDTKITKKTNIGYFIRFHGEVCYEIDQKFKENSKLLKYLMHKAPGSFNQNKKEQGLGKIMQILMNIFNDEKLYDRQNPRIINCDHYLRYTLDIEAFHLIDLKDIVREHLLSDETIQEERNFYYLDHEYPSYVKEKENYINNRQIEPPWTNPNSTMTKAIKLFKDTKISILDMCKVDDDLMDILKKEGYIRQQEHHVSYYKISKAFIQYLLKNNNIFKNKKTHKDIFNLKDTPLQILGVDRLHKYQIDTILRTKLRLSK